MDRQADRRTDRCALIQEVRSSKNEKLMTFPPHPQLVICLQVGGGEREESWWLHVSCAGRPVLWTGRQNQLFWIFFIEL